ncbi:MAG: tetratricopeptide repeat protein, partial [Myxococcota bacterium]
MITSSLPAFEAYSNAFGKTIVDTDFQTGAAGFLKSVELDPTFALAQFQIFTLSLLTREIDPDTATKARQAALTYLPRLPDRLQFLLKYFYYNNSQETQKAMRVLDLWAKLIPNDPLVYQLRASDEQLTGKYEAAVASISRALELFPGDSMILLQLADLHERANQNEKARDVYRRLIALFPEDTTGYLKLGDNLFEAAELTDAAEQYEHVVLLDPTNAAGQVGQALILSRSGDVDAALTQLETLSNTASSKQDRALALEKRTALLESRGRIDEAIKTFETWSTVAKDGMSYSRYLVSRARLHRLYVKANRTADAMSGLDAMA